MFRYFCFFAVILGVKSALAPFITPCKPGDNPCILAAAQAALPYIAPGIPELGIKSLDPMHLNYVKGDQGPLQMIFKNTIVTGMKDCSVDAVKQDLKKSKQYMTIRCSVVLKGDYKLSGQLIILPVQGEGPFTIKIKDIVIKTTTDISTITGDDGKPHWHISNTRHTFHVQTSTTFKLENLFNGNKILAEPVNQFVNSNWREVMNELAAPVVSSIVSNVVEAVEALYNAVPADQLAIL